VAGSPARIVEGAHLARLQAQGPIDSFERAGVAQTVRRPRAPRALGPRRRPCNNSGLPRTLQAPLPTGLILPGPRAPSPRTNAPRSLDPRRRLPAARPARSAPGAAPGPADPGSARASPQPPAGPSRVPTAQFGPAPAPGGSAVGPHAPRSHCSPAPAALPSARCSSSLIRIHSPLRRPLALGSGGAAVARAVAAGH
jgi:hypothetical protein